MQPWVSTLLIVLGSAIFLLLSKFIAVYSAGWFRAQFDRLLGKRLPEMQYIDGVSAGFVYPLRWYEEILWPLWLLPVIVMRLVGIPKRTSPTRDA